MTLLRRDGPAEQEQLAGRPDPDSLRQPRRASRPGHQAEPHLGQAEPCLGIGDDEVADERHLEAATHRGGLDGRDDGLGHRLDEPERPPARSDVILDRAVTVQQALELRQVGACHEGSVAGTGEHDGPHAGIRGEARRGRAQLLEHRVGEGIDRRVVDGDDGNPVRRLDADGVAHRASP